MDVVILVFLMDGKAGFGPKKWFDISSFLINFMHKQDFKFVLFLVLGIVASLRRKQPANATL